MPQEPDFFRLQDARRLRPLRPLAGGRSASGGNADAIASRSPATKTRKPSLAARRAARRWLARWRRAGHSATRRADQPSRSADDRMAGAGAEGAPLRARAHQAMTAASCRIFPGKPVWLDRGEARTVEMGFATFETWRDEQLAEEELNQHKLGRQIKREEHWIRYGVTARRKRNMRRVAEPRCAAQAASRPSRRGRQGLNERRRSRAIRRAA